MAFPTDKILKLYPDTLSSRNNSGFIDNYSYLDDRKLAT